VDAAGNGAGDGFGLVGKKGGADLIGSGSGSAGSRFAWYGALIKERLHEAILKEKRLRDAKDYQRLVNVWMNPNGSVSRVELIGAVDSAELDSALRDALGKVLPVRENLPSDMPQPVRLRITAR
jgi:protein TonB